MARLPASLSCFLISWPANPLGPYRAPSFTGSSPLSDHSRENFSPKCISCGKEQAHVSHIFLNYVKNLTTRTLGDRREDLRVDIWCRMSLWRYLSFGSFSFCIVRLPSVLRRRQGEARTAVEIKRTGPKPAEEISRWSLKTPGFATSEAALRAIHGYECVVRGTRYVFKFE